MDPYENNNTSAGYCLNMLFISSLHSRGYYLSLTIYIYNFPHYFPNYVYVNLTKTHDFQQSVDELSPCSGVTKLLGANIQEIWVGGPFALPRRLDHES